MKKKEWIPLGVAIVALLILIVTVYKILGALGNAFIIAVVILAIICVLVDFFWFQGLFLKIARKIGSKLKTKGGHDDVRH